MAEQQQETGAVSRSMYEVLIKGDLSSLTEQQRVDYYAAVCTSLGLNPLTKPFQFLDLPVFQYNRASGKKEKAGTKTVLYAAKDCTDQLRALRKISIEVGGVEIKKDMGVIIAHARATDPEGRKDDARGVVACGGLMGEDLANAVMKAETKAKRRVTLSICGLGFLDECEVADIPAEDEGGAARAPGGQARPITAAPTQTLSAPRPAERFDAGLPRATTAPAARQAPATAARPVSAAAPAPALTVDVGEAVMAKWQGFLSTCSPDDMTGEKRGELWADVGRDQTHPLWVAWWTAYLGRWSDEIDAIRDPGSGPIDINDVRATILAQNGNAIPKKLEAKLQQAEERVRLAAEARDAEAAGDPGEDDGEMGPEPLEVADPAIVAGHCHRIQQGQNIAECERFLAEAKAALPESAHEQLEAASRARCQVVGRVAQLPRPAAPSPARAPLPAPPPAPSRRPRSA